jgi:hypothetical protein
MEILDKNFNHLTAHLDLVVSDSTLAAIICFVDFLSWSRFLFVSSSRIVSISFSPTSLLSTASFILWTPRRMRSSSKASLLTPNATIPDIPSVTSQNAGFRPCLGWLVSKLLSIRPRFLSCETATLMLPLEYPVDSTRTSVESVFCPVVLHQKDG